MIVFLLWLPAVTAEAACGARAQPALWPSAALGTPPTGWRQPPRRHLFERVAAPQERDVVFAVESLAL